MYYLRCVENGKIIGRDYEGYPQEVHSHSGAVQGYITKEHALRQFKNIENWICELEPRKAYCELTWEVVKQVIQYEVV